MILTESRIEDVLRIGEAKHSLAAKVFIREAQQRFGVHITACYLQSHTQIDLPPGRSFARFIRTKSVPFVWEQILTLYVDSRLCRPYPGGEAQFGEELYALLCAILQEEGNAVDAPRLHLPEERVYYGWDHTKWENWDYSRVVETAAPSREHHAVFVEYIDKLALWRYLQDGLPAVRRCPVLRESGAKVFCGHDLERNSMAYYFVLPTRNEKGEVLEAAAAEFTRFAMERLQSRDRWGVIVQENVQPVVTDFASLTPELRWSFAKE